MDAPPSLETVGQALQALYNNPDVAGKERASIWLGELQKSVHAWQIADQLLRHNQSLESCYFAAQTMRTKIQYAFNELPQESHQSLRDSLLDHASKIAAGTPPVIVTQLSLALADLALQMATWKSAAQDFIEKFNKEQMNFLLEVLTVLPEEIASRSLRLGANRRREVTEELQAASPTLVQMLSHVNSTASGSGEEDQRLRAKTFKLLGSWFGAGALPQPAVVQSQLMSWPFQALMDAGCPAFLHEAATDCICSALYCAEYTPYNPQDMSQFNQLLPLLSQGVMALVPAYKQADQDEAADKCINYCRVFTELSESLFNSLVTSPNEGLGSFQLLEILLMCMGHHLYEVSEITFNFWYRLSEDLYQRDIPTLTDKFKPYVQALVMALSKHCQMDEDHEGIPDENGDFGDFRMRVSELIKDVVFIAGSSSCFTQMFETLKASAEASWSLSEASLFIMTAVAKNILPEENEIVPQVVEAILALPPTCHASVRYTSTQLLGELAEWIEHHPESLELILQFLLSGLQQPMLSSVSAQALQNLCSQCRTQMAAQLGGLMQIVQAMDSFSLAPDAAVGLLKGTATILSLVPAGEIADGLRQICKPQVEQLDKLVSAADATTGAVVQGSASDPTLWLDRLAAIFSGVSQHINPSVPAGQPHPCQPVIEEVWPVLSRTCERHQADDRVIERCCRCIRFAIRCLGRGSHTLLTPLVTQMVSLYERHPHSCFLYLGSILVDEYGGDAACVQGLLDMLQAFCGPTFKILEEHNGLRNHPDTVDDLFRLCLRFIQRSPVALLQSQLASAIMSCAVAAVALDHKDAHASVCKFLTELLQCHGHKEAGGAVASLVAGPGAGLVRALVHAALFCLPTFMSADVADVLYQLRQLDPQSFGGLLEATLADLPREKSGGSITATKEQLQEFHTATIHASDMRQMGAALREFTRLYR